MVYRCVLLGKIIEYLKAFPIMRTGNYFKHKAELHITFIPINKNR